MQRDERVHLITFFFLCQGMIFKQFLKSAESFEFLQKVLKCIVCFSDYLPFPFLKSLLDLIAGVIAYLGIEGCASWRLFVHAMGPGSRGHNCQIMNPKVHFIRKAEENKITF